MKPNCSQIGDIDLPGKNRSWHDISWHDCTGFWWFLRTSTWSGSNIRYRRKAMRAVSWHQHFTVMTSAIQHASNIAVLWHFTIFDEFDVELLRRFHTPTPPSWSKKTHVWDWNESVVCSELTSYIFDNVTAAYPNSRVLCNGQRAQGLKRIHKFHCFRVALVSYLHWTQNTPIARAREQTRSKALLALVTFFCFIKNSM